MGVFGRDGSAWTESDMRARAASAWTDQYDNGFARVDGAWVQFQPGAQGELLAPVGLGVAATQNTATGTWTNPDQPVTPTHIQVRIPELTPVWTEYTYPITTTIFSALDPSTPYQLQVRYIVRSQDDGSVAATGPIATAFFTTSALSGPGTPAPDPMGTGPDSIIPWGNTGGTPGVVGGSDCWWEYVIQEFSYETGFTDTLITAEVDGDIGSLAFDFVAEGFACGAVLRWKYREVCNSIPDDWQFASAFSVICDYTDTCGGSAQTAAFTDNALYSDADIVFAMPKMCWNNVTFKNEILDFVAAGTEYGKLSGFAVPLYRQSAWELVAKSGLSVYGEPLVAGRVPGLVPIGSSVPALTSDFTFTFDVLLDIVPQGGSGAPVKLLEIGKTCKVYAYADGASWTVTVSIPKEGGGTFDLVSTTQLTTDEWHKITVTIDQDGDKILYLDGVADTTDADTTRAGFGDFNSEVELYMNDNGAQRLVAGWGRVLTPGEVGLLNAPPYPYFIAESGEAITASATSFMHTLPSGIAAGDLIMVLWKTNETASVKVVAAPPLGWTQADLDRATFLWWKIADGTETTVTASWTGAASNDPMVHSTVYRNVDPLAPFLRPSEVVADSSTTTVYNVPDSAPAVSPYDINKTQAQLDNWSSFMEGTSYVGTTYAGTPLTLSTPTDHQPNLLERQSTVNTNDVKHWSHEGITENSGLYNDQRAEWTHTSSFGGGFHAILRAPRTPEWLAKTHVAYRHSTMISNSFDTTAVPTAAVAHLDGMLALVMVSSVDRETSFDLANPTNAWMTALNANTYYGTWAAAGRSLRDLAAGGPISSTFIIANANLSDPASLALERSVNGATPLHNYRFWTRPDQLIVGQVRTSNYDSALAATSGGTITVERQEYQVNNVSGNQTAQLVEGRGVTAGYGTLPAVTPPVSWSGNGITWVGINHSTESSPALVTPTIVGTPTVQTKATGGPGAMTITKPSGATVGEILLMITHIETGGEIQNTAPGPPAGFEPIQQGFSGHSGVGQWEMWMKVVDGTEPASWAPIVNGEGTIVMQRMTGILPRRGAAIASDTTTLTNPHPIMTPTLFEKGIFLRGGAVQDGTARVIDVSVGTDILVDSDVPPLSISTTHINITGEVLAGTVPGAASYTVTPFPGAPPAARCYVYHLDAAPA